VGIQVDDAKKVTLKVYVTVTDAAPKCPGAELAAPNRRRRVVLDRLANTTDQFFLAAACRCLCYSSLFILQLVALNSDLSSRTSEMFLAVEIE